MCSLIHIAASFWSISTGSPKSMVLTCVPLLSVWALGTYHGSRKWIAYLGITGVPVHSCQLSVVGDTTDIEN